MYYKLMYFVLNPDLINILLLKIDPHEICTNDILTEIDSGNRSCGCGVECNEKDYELKTASSQWPSKEYEVR